MGRSRIPFDQKYVPEPNSGCWLWTSGWDSDGYGLATGNKKAHRLSYERSVGPIPIGACVCHRCDTPACVNPAHLFLGTNAENTADRKMKGRGSMGASSPHAKLTEAQVMEILTSKESKRALASRFGVTPGAIAHIRRGSSWKDAVQRIAAQAGVFIPDAEAA